MEKRPGTSRGAVDRGCGRNRVRTSHSPGPAEKSEVASPTWIREPPERAISTGSTAWNSARLLKMATVTASTSSVSVERRRTGPDAGGASAAGALNGGGDGGGGERPPAEHDLERRPGGGDRGGDRR